jgi:phage baseplate assembly protein W
MANYIGFSTLDTDNKRDINIPLGVTTSSGLNVPPSPQTSKFKLVDNRLVFRDILNAFNILQGQKPGNPEYGTIIYSMLFEPNTSDTHAQIENEVRRIIGQDPRILLNTVSVTPNDNGIMVEVELAIVPDNMAQMLALQFDKGTGTATMA